MGGVTLENTDGRKRYTGNRDGQTGSNGGLEENQRQKKMAEELGIGEPH